MGYGRGGGREGRRSLDWGESVHLLKHATGGITRNQIRLDAPHPDKLGDGGIAARDTTRRTAESRGCAQLLHNHHHLSILLSGLSSPSARVSLSRTGLRAMTSPPASLEHRLHHCSGRRDVRSNPHPTRFVAGLRFHYLRRSCTSRPSVRLSRRVCSSPVRVPVLGRPLRPLPSTLSPGESCPLPLFRRCTDALSAVPPQISLVARVDRCRMAHVFCRRAARIQSRGTWSLYPYCIENSSPGFADLDISPYTVHAAAVTIAPPPL